MYNILFANIKRVDIPGKFISKLQAAISDGTIRSISPAPQSAILGMHAIQERPMAVDGEVLVRPMMYVALTYDHRIIDGREAVQFLVKLKQLLEDPGRLLLQL